MLKVLTFSAVAGLALLGVSVSFASALSEKVSITNLPPGQFDWERTPEGVGFAPLIGERFEEPYMAMVHLPAGLVSPAHSKTANMFGVVVSGTLVHVTVGTSTAEEVPLPAGSYYKIPANLPHISKCVSQTDCVTFLYQDGKFDFLPTGS